MPANCTLIDTSLFLQDYDICMLLTCKTKILAWSSLYIRAYFTNWASEQMNKNWQKSKLSQEFNIKAYIEMLLKIKK